jgi:hypothetical protein
MAGRFVLTGWTTASRSAFGAWSASSFTPTLLQAASRKDWRFDGKPPTRDAREARSFKANGTSLWGQSS